MLDRVRRPDTELLSPLLFSTVELVALLACRRGQSLSPELPSSSPEGKSAPDAPPKDGTVKAMRKVKSAPKLARCLVMGSPFEKKMQRALGAVAVFSWHLLRSTCRLTEETGLSSLTAFAKLLPGDKATFLPARESARRALPLPANHSIKWTYRCRTEVTRRLSPGRYGCPGCYRRHEDDLEQEPSEAGR